jgi:hypothetical protein
MNAREENHKRFEPVTGVIVSFKEGCNAKVLYCENGEHKAGEKMKFSLGENLLEFVKK